MPQSDNHSYNVPNEGDPNWDVPLNENFRDFDTDIELHDVASNRSSYTPKDGAKFLATDTGVVSLGDGSSWLPSLAVWRFTAPSASGAAGNLVAGHPSNSVASGASGATIAGGGFDDGTDVRPNEVTADYGTIAGGQLNTAGNGSTVGGGVGNTADSGDATVGGGANNVATSTQATVAGGNGNEASGGVSTVAGGSNNEATADFAAVGGGVTNVASARAATVAGGDSNSAEREGATVGGGVGNTASGFFSTVSGGENNGSFQEYATVGGGTGNETNGNNATVSGGRNNAAAGMHATVGGGDGNVASGDSATIPGGNQCTADGARSFATGLFADTDGNDGAMVFADGSNLAVTADAPDQFVVQAGGGAKIYSESDTAPAAGVELPPGDGSWASLSARAAKSNLESVDPANALKGVRDLEITTWNYDTQGESIRHMGPMAGDFHDEFGIGGDPERISTVDADGVALAAIQGLSKKLDEKDERIEAQRERIDDLEASVDRLRREIDEPPSRSIPTEREAR